MGGRAGTEQEFDSVLNGCREQKTAAVAYINWVKGKKLHFDCKMDEWLLLLHNRPIGSQSVAYVVN